MKVDGWEFWNGIENADDGLESELRAVYDTIPISGERENAVEGQEISLITESCDEDVPEISEPSLLIGLAWSRNFPGPIPFCATADMTVK